MRHGKTLARRNARWPGSGKLLTMPTVAAIVLSVLFLTGCAAHRKSVTKAKEEQLSETIRTDSVIRLAIDSVIELVEIRTEPVKVPMSAVTLTIATDSLRSLPAGASYSERSGQASVKVSRKAATATEPEYIYVYASCDSLQLQCERYERQIRNLHSQYDERLNEMQNRLAATSHELEDVKEKPPNAIGTALKWFFYGLLSGILATIIIFIKLKK
nr:MAG TPA: Hemolysin [Caudoviricetes sp.]